MERKIKIVIISVSIVFLIVVGLDILLEQPIFNQQAPSLKEFEFTAVHLGTKFEFPVEHLGTESGMGEEVMIGEGTMSSMMHRFVIAEQYNPTIEVKQGDFVKLKFKNTDTMMLHDLAIPSLGLQTETLSLDEYGEIEFIANTKGELEYLCTLHPDQMSGKIVIT